MVIEVVVQTGARLHDVNHALLCALFADFLVNAQRRRIHGAIRTAAIQDDVHIGRGQFIAGKQRCLAKFGDVRQNRYTHRLAHFFCTY